MNNSNVLFPLLLTAANESELDAKYETLNKILVNDTGVNQLAISLAGNYSRSDCCRSIAVYNNNDRQLTLAFRNQLTTEPDGIKNRPIAFMFTGVGGHYINMAKGLYQTNSLFKEIFDYCCDFLQPLTKKKLTDIIYSNVDSNENNYFNNILNHQCDFKKIFNKFKSDTEVENKLNQSSFLHPLLFIIEYAVSQLCIKCGIIPQFLIGHSIGEYVATTIAGVLALEDALILITRRAQLIEQLPHGAMVTILAGKNDLTAFLEKIDNLFLAAENSPISCTVSGPEKDIIKLETDLEKNNIAYLRLSTDRAFHSALMQPINEKFVNIFKQTKIGKIKIPFLSNLTGDWATNPQVIDSNNWFLHTSKTVCFSDGLKKLLNIKNIILIEIGPGQILTGFAFQHKFSASNPNVLIVSALRSAHDNIADNAFWLNMLSKLWVNGVNINWNAVFQFYSQGVQCKEK